MAFKKIEISAEKLESLDNEHDEVCVFNGTERAPFLFVLRRPKAKDLKAYAQLAKQDAVRANMELLKALTVYPEREDVERQLDRWPTAAGAVLTSNTYAEFTGSVLADHQK